MRCPYFHKALEESSAECPSCKLTLSRAPALLGPVPRFAPGLDEALRVLEKRDVKKLGERIDEMQRRFPQVKMHIIVRDFPSNHPFDLFLFLIFNHAGLSEESHKGGENRDILLVIDPSQTRCGLIVGYGLEPFLRDETLDHLLELAEPAFRDQRWLDGFITIIDGLDQLLESAAIDLAEAMGVPTQQSITPVDGEY